MFILRFFKKIPTLLLSCTSALLKLNVLTPSWLCILSNVSLRYLGFSTLQCAIRFTVSDITLSPEIMNLLINSGFYNS